MSDLLDTVVQKQVKSKKTGDVFAQAESAADPGNTKTG